MAKSVIFGSIGFSTKKFISFKAVKIDRSKIRKTLSKAIFNFYKKKPNKL